MSKKILTGQVVGKSLKSITVEYELIRVHPKYKKRLKLHRHIIAHDETQEAKIGDLVKVVETRPISKRKSWKLTEVVK